jgi:hypothetical protein
MKQLDVKGAMDAVLSLLGKTALSQENMYSYKIPNSDDWVVVISKDRFYPDVLKEFKLVAREHRWQLGDGQKEGYWDVQ